MFHVQPYSLIYASDILTREKTQKLVDKIFENLKAVTDTQTKQWIGDMKQVSPFGSEILRQTRNRNIQKTTQEKLNFLFYNKSTLTKGGVRKKAGKNSIPKVK